MKKELTFGLSIEMEQGMGISARDAMVQMNIGVLHILKIHEF